ncbi:hypothetical protein EB001_08555 [bacterium]|nr:hypothetical protein [bacterium]
MLNILGIVSGVVGKILDTFTRSNTVSTLGNTETGNTWNILSGTWKINNNKAESTSTPTDYALASVELGSYNAKVSADISDGGMGPALWISSANSWWASSVNYRSVFTDTSTTGSDCNGGSVPGKCGTCGGTETNSPTCSWSFTGSTYTNTTGCPYIDPCGSGFSFDTQSSSSTTSSCSGSENYGSSTPPSPVVCTIYNSGSICSRSFVAPLGVWYVSRCANTTTYTCKSYIGPTYTDNWSCSQSARTYTIPSGYTTYYTELKLYAKSSGSVSTITTLPLTNNTTSYTTAGSIFMQSSGDIITAKAYSGAGLTGSQIGQTLSYTASSPTKGLGVGIIKTPSTANQGSTIDNFNAETSL